MNTGTVVPHYNASRYNASPYITRVGYVAGYSTLNLVLLSLTLAVNTAVYLRTGLFSGLMYVFELKLFIQRRYSVGSITERCSNYSKTSPKRTQGSKYTDCHRAVVH